LSSSSVSSSPASRSPEAGTFVRREGASRDGERVIGRVPVPVPGVSGDARDTSWNGSVRGSLGGQGREVRGIDDGPGNEEGGARRGREGVSPWKSDRTERAGRRWGSFRTAP